MLRSAYKCCVEGCSFKGGSSHRFPNPKRNSEMFWKWVELLGTGNLSSNEPRTIYEKRRVCSNHFNADNFNPGTKKLKSNAMPHIGIPKSIQTDGHEVNNVKIENINSSSPILTEFQSTPKNDIGSSKHNIDLNMSDVEELNVTSNDCGDIEPDTLNISGIEEFTADNLILCGNDEHNYACIKNFVKHKPKRAGILSEIGVSKVNQLTPKCKSLYKKRAQLSKRLRWEQKKSSNFKTRLAAAEKLSNRVLNSKTASRMTSAAAVFTNLQLHETIRKARGRRFTIKEKLLSLSLYKQSAKSYHILAKLFTLPSRKTLNNLLSKIPVNPGIDHTLMKVLKTNIIKLSDKHKLCVVLFDEVSLDANLMYDHSTGMITGFEDNGTARTQKFADHSLVFMIRGVVRKYKQPIAYSFYKGTTNSHDLTNQLRSVIQAIHETGLHVVATICDQGATNKAAINILKNDMKGDMIRKNIEYKEEFYNVECKGDIMNIIHLYDPPHLLKGIRNNFLNKNVLFTMNGKQMEARWCDIVELYELDCKTENVKMLPRLTAEHVIPQKIKKMKVKCAAQVLSERVASIMSFLASQKIINENAKDTGKFCHFFDQLFDSVNGSFDKVVDGKIYRTGLKRYSPHHQLWEEAIQVLQSMYFINPVTKKKSSPQPPTIKNWIKTIKGFQEVFKFLNKFGIKSILLRNFNQDALENFFGALRALCYRNVNPTCHLFTASYKTLLLNNLMSSHSPGSNCEEDFGDGCLTSYQSLFQMYEDNTADESVETEKRVADGALKSKSNFSSDVLLHLESQTKNYIAVFVIKKLNTVLFKNCSICLQQVCSLKISKQHDLTVARDYNPHGKFLLKYPNQLFCLLVKNSIHLISHLLPSLCHHKTLKSELTNILMEQINVNMINCPEHGHLFSKQFVDFIIKMMVHNWCTQINRILSGKLGLAENESDQIKISAFHHYQTYSKKSKYK